MTSQEREPITPERLAEAIKRRLWLASPTLQNKATAKEADHIARALVDLFAEQAAEVDRLRAQAEHWREAAERNGDLYREVVGTPVPEHQARRMESIALAWEETVAERDQLRALLAAERAKIAAAHVVLDEYAAMARLGTYARIRAALTTGPEADHG